MKHASMMDLKRRARVSTVAQGKSLSKVDRLERWAALLDDLRGQRLPTLNRIEQTPRAEGSALTVAYNDPVLRADGLRGDTVGDAMNYFGLTFWDVHRITCYCNFGQTESAEASAAAVRAMVPSRSAERIAFAVLASAAALGMLAVI